jgi:hypothetical protein
MFVRLKQQPWDLPDFILDRCLGNLCWVRQQSWGPNVYLRIPVTQIAIPDTPGEEMLLAKRAPLPDGQNQSELITVEKH